MDSSKNSRYLIGFEVAYKKDIPCNPIAFTNERHKMDLEVSWNGYDVPGLRHILEKYARDRLSIREYTDVAVVITFALELKENPNAET
jgi:hypothetical protein